MTNVTEKELRAGFIQWLERQVSEIGDRYGVDGHRAFPAWAHHYVFGVDEDDAYSQTDTLTQGDAGLDGWFYDRQEGVLHLTQAKWLGDKVAGVPGDLSGLIQAALLLQNPESILDGPHREKLSDAAALLADAIQDDHEISLDFFIAGRVPEVTRGNIEGAVAGLGSRFSISWYETTSLYEIWLADEPIQDLRGQTISFLVSEPSEYYVRATEDTEGVSKWAVATLDGRSLADAVYEHGARLFQGNVRYHLGQSNRVNKAIGKTLRDPSGRAHFWLFNNGITIVADSFDLCIDPDTSAPRVEATNPQVVNGAQTSSALKANRSILTPGAVSVQARFIAVSENEIGRETLGKISEYTNSQTRVDDSDLVANDPRQKHIQANFSALPEKVFYERRRGEFASLSPGERRRYQRKVTKHDVGQRWLGYCGYPADAIAKKNEIFGSLYDRAFDSKVSAAQYLIAFDLFAQAEALLKKTGEANILTLVPLLGDPATQAPESPTRLEIFRRASKLTSMHASALAGELIRQRYGKVSPDNAHKILTLLTPRDGSAAQFLWRQIFRLLRQWQAEQPDYSMIKLLLQRPQTYQLLRDRLTEALEDVDLVAGLPDL